MNPLPPRLGTAVVALALVALALPAAAQSNGYELSNLSCATGAAPNGRIVWPAEDPIWQMDFVRPAARTTTDGAGLELRDVYYRGRLVFRRAHAPILNVQYDGGAGCSCFRDWSYSEAGFTAGNPVTAASCIAEPAAGTVLTHCDVASSCTSSGSSCPDPGSFRGVAVEDYGNELVLTTHLQAGWYRYRMRWHFYPDGRIWPEYSFSARPNSCTNGTHRHHTYWRFDFDIDGPGNELVTEHNPAASTQTPILTEAARTWGNAADGIFWRIADTETGFGYDVVPSSADRLLPVDGFSKADALILRYKPTGEFDDRATSGGACAINFDTPRNNIQPMVNGEDVNGQDLVFWYRSGAVHAGGDWGACDIGGPILRPHGLVPTDASPQPPPADGLVLEAARPNPFNPTTTVRFRVAAQQYVTVALYDVTGRRVATLFEGFARENREEAVRIDGTNLPAGPYVVRLEGETVHGTTRVVLVR